MTSDVRLRDVIGTIPRIACQVVGEASLDGCFDLAVMHTVNKHLLDINAVFRQTARALRPGGEI